MTTKQNRGGPASPSHPSWLHRNTKAMPTLQTYSFPLSSAMLHYPVLSQAQRSTAPLSQHYTAMCLPTVSQALCLTQAGCALALRHQVTLSLHIGTKLQYPYFCCTKQAYSSHSLVRCSEQFH